MRGIDHREIEFPVVEHLGPQCPRDEAADRLDEHAVFVGRYRLVLAIDMDLGLQRRSLGTDGEAGGQHERRTSAEECGGPKFSHVRRSEEHTSELQSLMRSSYAVFCLK